MPIILAAKLFLGIFYNLSVWYKLTNKTLYGAAISIIGAIITIGLNVLLIPKYGYMGSAWANFACYFSMMIISFFWGRAVFKVEYNYVKLLTYTVLAALIFFVANQLKTNINFSLQIAFNTIKYLFFILAVYLREKKILKQKVK